MHHTLNKLFRINYAGLARKIWKCECIIAYNASHCNKWLTTNHYRWLFGHGGADGFTRLHRFFFSFFLELFWSWQRKTIEYFYSSISCRFFDDNLPYIVRYFNSLPSTSETIDSCRSCRCNHRLNNATNLIRVNHTKRSVMKRLNINGSYY